jgi:hypothetical protein
MNDGGAGGGGGGGGGGGSEAQAPNRNVAAKTTINFLSMIIPLTRIFGMGEQHHSADRHP